MEKSEQKLSLLKKIEEYERLGFFDKDIEDDPESIELLPNKIDYLNEKLSSRIATFLANKAGTKFFEKMIKNRQVIIKDVIGIENFTSLQTGAIITCNHFNVFDNYAIWHTIKPYMGKKRLWKVIKEGNYTNPPPVFGFTLKISPNLDFKAMKKFLKSVKVLLGRGEKILVYPEQAMWWNYKKPRPLKEGAFRFAVTNNVPVLPIFITLQDSDVEDGEGFFVQEYTLHILPAIYPDEGKTRNENINFMKDENYRMWKEVYENFYKTKLVYTTEK